MTTKHSNWILIGIVVALAMSAIVVVACNAQYAAHPETFAETYRAIIHYGKFLGDFFLLALKMVIVPLVFASVVMGITHLGDVRKIGGIGLRTLLYYGITTGLAVALGIILVVLIQPGAGMGDVLTGTLDDAMRSNLAAKQDIHVTDLFLSLLHPNLIEAFAQGKMLPIIVFSLVFGAILTTLGEKGAAVMAFFDGLNDAMMKMVALIMWLAPIGIFGLVVAKFGVASMQEGGLAKMIEGLWKYSLTVVGAITIHGLITLPALLFFLTRRNPLKFAFDLVPALLTAWSTASSSATLPLTIECAVDRAKLDKKASGFVLPLGATINMDGTALYEAVAAVFIAQAYGIDLGLGQLVLVFITATLAGIGAAGIPQAGLVMMVIVLKAVNLPIEGIGLILAVDWLLDRFRTTLNVWGDTVGAAYISGVVESTDVPESALD